MAVAGGHTDTTVDFCVRHLGMDYGMLDFNARDGDVTNVLLNAQSVHDVGVLTQDGYDIHARDTKGETAIFCSHTVQALMKNGADIHCTDT
jgi:hypothetical protein